VTRLYKALAWLAGVAIVVGVVRAIVFLTQAINALSQGGYSFSLSDGLLLVFVAILRSELPVTLMSAANLLIGGVLVMTVIVAWADRRYRWLVALSLFSLLALLWPLGVQIWYTTALAATPLHYPTLLAQFTRFGTVSALTAPLIPLLLAFIFAFTRRRAGSGASAPSIAVQPA